MVALVLVEISIVLSITYSNYIVTSNDHKAAEMYIGELKYSIEIDGSTTNTLIVPTGETIIDVKVNNLNPVDTYYKLLYLKNTNITVKYYESTKDTNDVVTTYNKPNDSITSSNLNTIKLLITNNSTSSQNIALTMRGGYITNTVQDITTPSTYSEITLVETPSTNTYFCTTTDTLTQGLKYVNGQYTYAYKQQGKYADSGLAWQNITSDGWGVQLTDKASTNAVTSKVCTYINNVPITSMSYMFSYSQATTIDLSNFDTSNVTSMRSMFSYSQATTLDVSNFDTSNVTYMNIMFGNSQATTLDVSNFDTSNVTTMGQMFESSQATTLDLSHFDTSKVTNMSYMFWNSKSTMLDVSNFNTSKVTNMSYMFWNSKSTMLDVSNFNTSNVTNMSYMFSGSKATTLDLSNFNTSNVTNMAQMFNSSTNLKTIYVSNKFNTDKVTSSTYMFNGCTKLVGGAGTKYNSSYVDKAYARIDGGTSSPGYFTKAQIFSEDSWDTIVANIRAGKGGGYKVGSTRTINMGTYGTHTLRIANTSTPSECSTSGFSQSACGFVLEFVDIITEHKMNDTHTNVGGWPATLMRTFVNNDIYNAIPSEIKNAIINTTVVSGHGREDTTNFTSTDKLYLLAPGEVWSDWKTNTSSDRPSFDTAKDLTRTLDYYTAQGVTLSNFSGAIKKKGTSAYWWWLRTAMFGDRESFSDVRSRGGWDNNVATNTTLGVSPAFRLG